MSPFLFIMVLNILKFTLQKEKKRIFIFKYCKIDVKTAATLIFAATLITAPTVCNECMAYLTSVLFTIVSILIYSNKSFYCVIGFDIIQALTSSTTAMISNI